MQGAFLGASLAVSRFAKYRQSWAASDQVVVSSHRQSAAPLATAVAPGAAAGPSLDQCRHQAVQVGLAATEDRVRWEPSVHSLAERSSVGRALCGKRFAERADTAPLSAVMACMNSSRHKERRSQARAHACHQTVSWNRALALANARLSHRGQQFCSWCLWQLPDWATPWAAHKWLDMGL